MAKLWSFCGYNIGVRTVNSTFRVSCSRRRDIMHHSGCPTIFCVHKHNEEEMVCTLSFKNNASASEKVRVVAGRAIDHGMNSWVSMQRRASSYSPD